MQGIRIAFASLLAAASAVRLWLLGWLLVTVPAFLLAWPLWVAWKGAYDHHPGATLGLNQHLDADFARQHPELTLASAGAALFVLLGWTWLGGGILALAGSGRPWRLAEVLAEGGRLLPRHLRALGLGLVLALGLAYGVAFLDTWLRTDALADTDPGATLGLLGLRFRLFSLEAGLEGLRWLYGLLFLGLLFASKLARAFLIAPEQRSATAAWGRAALRMLRHPIRTAQIVLLLTAAWLGAGFALAPLLAWADQKGHTWALLGLAQLLVVLLQILLVAGFLAARALASAPPRAAAAPTPAPAPRPAGRPPELLFDPSRPA